MGNRIYTWGVLLSERKSGLICGCSTNEAKNLAAKNLGFDSAAEYINSFPDKGYRDHYEIFDVENADTDTDLERITKEIFKICEKEKCTDVVMMPTLYNALCGITVWKTQFSGTRNFYLCSDWKG